METKTYIGLLELSRRLGVAYWRIAYAHKTDALPWPERIVGTLAYGDDDVQRVKDYFAAKESRRRKVA